MLNGNHILVTGSTGLIGQAVVYELLTKNGYRLRLQVRNAKEARVKFNKFTDLNRVEIIECDFTKCSDLDSYNLTKGCDTVIHLAGLVHKPSAPYQDYELLNVRATDQLFTSAQSNEISTFIFLSSSVVYGNGPFSSVDEDAPLKGETPYAVSKINCEQILERPTNIGRVVNLRPAMVFGEGDRGNLIKLIQTISKKRYVQIGAGKTLKSLIYSRDLAKAIIGCMDKLSSGRYVLNVANPEAISMKNLSTEIWHALGHNGKILSIPEQLLLAALKITDKVMPGRLPVNEEQISKLTTETTLNVYKLAAMTDFHPTFTLGAALRAEIKWARDQGLI